MNRYLTQITTLNNDDNCDWLSSVLIWIRKTRSTHTEPIFLLAFRIFDSVQTTIPTAVGKN